jgi:riboflavin kinase / FMN adenylyltransferase
MVKEHLNITRLWVGYDFALGKNREGDISALSDIGKDLNFNISVFQPVQDNGLIISSRQIRQFLQQGHVDRAAELLGRYYSINGKIIHGDGRGHLLGIPTTNLAYSSIRLLPRPGIYATFAHVGKDIYRAVTNIGTNPTFIDPPLQSLRVETHILDFSGDLYDTEQSIDFCYFIRGEEKFNNVEDLKTRIHKDILFARQNLRLP